MTDMADTVFLFDVDNTLLDNDRMQADLGTYLAETFGGAVRDRYWAIFQQLFAELGYADYLGALGRYRLEAMHDPSVLRISGWLLGYPFADRIYPGAIDAVRRAKTFGTAGILSDGDAVFQPRKVERSGLWPLFDDNVLIYVHKELELADVEAHLPARHYVLIDDKLRILDAVKRAWGDRVTTVFPRQGHYATDPKVLAEYPPADVTIERMGDFSQLDLEALVRR